MKRILSIAIAAFVIAGCDSSSDPVPVPDSPPPPPPPTASVQVLHASPDAPAVNVNFDGITPPAGSQTQGVTYKMGTGKLTVNEGSYDVTVDAILPDATTTTVIGPANLTFDEGTLTTIVAVGSVAEGTLAPIVLTQAEDVTAGFARLRVLHGAPMAPPVDVYATAPGADLGASPVLANLAFGESSDAAEVPPGDYQVRVTLAGDPDTVVFDAGTVTLNDGDDLFATAVENTTTGLSPITLAILNGTEAVEVFDVDAPADLRVVHASPDTGPVDVLADGAELIGDLAFPDFTGFLSVPAGTYDVAVTPANMPGTIALQADDLVLDAGVRYTVVALDEFANIDVLIRGDAVNRVATEAKVRIIHASPTAADVDIYVTAPEADISGATPLLANVPFKAETGYMSVTPGEYDISVTPTGTTDVALFANVTFEAAGIYTIIAVDAEGGGAPIGAILMDDFAD